MIMLLKSSELCLELHILTEIRSSVELFPGHDLTSTRNNWK